MIVEAHFCNLEVTGGFFERECVGAILLVLCEIDVAYLSIHIGIRAKVVHFTAIALIGVEVIYIPFDMFQSP